MTARTIDAEDGPDGGKVLIIQEGAPDSGTLTVIRLNREEVVLLRGLLPPRVRAPLAPPPLPDDPGSPDRVIADDGRLPAWERVRPWLSSLADGGWFRR